MDKKGIVSPSFPALAICSLESFIIPQSQLVYTGVCSPYVKVSTVVCMKLVKGLENTNDGKGHTLRGVPPSFSHAGPAGSCRAAARHANSIAVARGAGGHTVSPAVLMQG